MKLMEHRSISKKRSLLNRSENHDTINIVAIVNILVKISDQLQSLRSSKRKYSQLHKTWVIFELKHFCSNFAHNTEYRNNLRDE